MHIGFAAQVPTLSSYWDTMYFTVTTLTTTGFGDNKPPCAAGHVLSIIMIGAMSLHFQPLQVTIGRPNVRHDSASCESLCQELDAVHRKACGAAPWAPMCAPTARFLIGASVRGGDDLYPSPCLAARCN